ncbi:predicted protein [Lichtheimia corymbifera JMRC:FSU:9682]|uniref:Uncharacterized protein n=1 Tax=Lichtheimia corymbifera JMRC:FSU:9682 TaxID=1263082 RepID=A0A068S1E7_9FUNG|nr:predicted protein [Lichtheimia corymbifera JMRC:FSU:9682]
MGVNLLETDRQECYTIGMDWRGFSGLMYTVHKMGTIYVSKSLGDLLLTSNNSCKVLLAVLWRLTMVFPKIT